EAVRRRIVVAAMRLRARDALGARPGLIRQLAVGRIDDEAAARRRQEDLRARLEAVVAAAGVDLEPAGEVGLAVRHAANRARGLGIGELGAGAGIERDVRGGNRRGIPRQRVTLELAVRFGLLGLAVVFEEP